MGCQSRELVLVGPCHDFRDLLAAPVPNWTQTLKNALLGNGPQPPHLWAEMIALRQIKPCSIRKGTMNAFGTLQAPQPIVDKLQRQDPPSGLFWPFLRDRKEDLPVLLVHYIAEMNRRFGRSVVGLTENALHYLLEYNWPGKVRELRNLIEAIFVNLCPQEIIHIDLSAEFCRSD